MQILKKKNKTKGVALFIAVVAVSGLLLIAAAITDIAFKEQILTFAGRDSKVAFYASDTGLECALYHDLRVENFFPTNPQGVIGNIYCNDVPPESINKAVIDAGNNETISIFSFNIVDDSQNACTVVTVSKKLIPEMGGDGEIVIGETIETRIVSRGYNNICGDDFLPLPNPRNMERALEVTY